MAWIEVHQHLKEHRKTRKLKNLMGITRAQAMGHLVMLWLWGIDNTDDYGIIQDADNDDIAVACDYQGDSNMIISSLLEAGFLEKEASGKLFIHDFEDYIGKLRAHKKRHREAQKRYSEKSKSNPNDGHADSHTDGQSDGTNDSLKIANLTVPNLTVPSPNKATIILTSEENEFLAELVKVKGYPRDREKDLAMFKNLEERYPQLSLVSAIKDWVVHKLDVPLKDGQNPRSQINTSMKKNIEWGKNLKQLDKPKNNNGRNGVLSDDSGPLIRRDDM